MTTLVHLRIFYDVCFLLDNSPSMKNYLPMKVEQTECSKISAYKIQTPGNYPEESIQHSEHSKNLKSRKDLLFSHILYTDKD